MSYLWDASPRLRALALDKHPQISRDLVTGRVKQCAPNSRSVNFRFYSSSYFDVKISMTFRATLHPLIMALWQITVHFHRNFLCEKDKNRQKSTLGLRQQVKKWTVKNLLQIFSTTDPGFSFCGPRPKFQFSNFVY